MDIPQYPAVSAFCRIIADLPDGTRLTALGFLCTALGQPPDPTGIPFSTDRPIRHLHWDHECKDLYSRLVYLVEKVGLKEQLAVQGAVSYIVSHFALWADPVFSQSCSEGFRRTIESMDQQLRLPLERREARQSDNEIAEFISQLRGLIESAETRRIEAADTYHRIATVSSGVFTNEFWDALNHLGINRSRGQIDNLLDPQQDDDTEEG